MASAYKILGQIYPGAAAYELLYTVPAATQAIASSISICNQDAVASDTFRVSIRQGGVADATKDKLYYNLPILFNDTFIATIGSTLSATDEVWVWSTNGTCSFQLFGQENT